MKHSFILLVMITFGVIFLGHTATAQITFAIPPKVYPAKVPFRCDAGVDRYWHVTSITCTGRANGGYKFRIKGMAQKTSRSLMIDLFYLIPGNRIKTAGTYYFPQIEEGKPFSFEIVSAFSGYAPSRFNGFLISSEVLQKSLLREQEVRAVADNRSESGTDESVVKGEEVTPEPEKPKVNPNKVYLSTDKAVERQPEFPGGLGAFMGHIARNVRYPWICKELKVQGKVMVGFVVEKDGSVSNVTVLKKVHANLDTEAVRVVKSSPRWTPGVVEGQPARVQMAVTVTFKL